MFSAAVKRGSENDNNHENLYITIKSHLQHDRPAYEQSKFYNRYCLVWGTSQNKQPRNSHCTYDAGTIKLIIMKLLTFRQLFCIILGVAAPFIMGGGIRTGLCCPAGSSTYLLCTAEVFHLEILVWGARFSLRWGGMGQYLSNTGKNKIKSFKNLHLLL